jgi:hypothetical protein
VDTLPGPGPCRRHHPSLQQELERRVRARTGRRVLNLTVELQADRVVLRGRASSYHIKQLAQHGVLELLPDVPLDNAIAVEPQPACAPHG